VLRISGFFRDALPDLIILLDAAVRAVADLDEDDATNPLRARVRRDEAALAASGASTTAAARAARLRIFGSRPGAYGTGVGAVLEHGRFADARDLARQYLAASSHAYGAGADGAPAAEALQRTLAGVDAVVQNQDNREHDVLDSGDYFEFHGGMAAAVELTRGAKVALYHGDHANPEGPRVRGLNEELGRVLRSRAVNPKWIAGVRRHGYKGAAEMAATVEYLVGWAATTGVVAGHQFAMLSDAYLLDPGNRRFLAEHNPAALREMAERLLDAIDRGLWQEPGPHRAALEGVLLDAEEGCG
jgi:cobaltochelatase CobN